MPFRSPKLPRHTPPTKKVYIGEAAVVRNELNATLTKLRNDLEEKATIYQNSTGTISVLEKENEELEQNITKIRIRTQTEINSLKQEYQKVLLISQEKDKELEKVTAEAAKAAETATEAIAKATEATTKATKATTESVKLEEIEADYKKRTDKLKKEIEEQKKEIQQMKQQIDTKDNKIEKQEKEIQTKDKKIEEQVEQIKKKDEEFEQKLEQKLEQKVEPKILQIKLDYMKKIDELTTENAKLNLKDSTKELKQDIDLQNKVGKISEVAQKQINSEQPDPSKKPTTPKKPKKKTKKEIAAEAAEAEAEAAAAAEAE